MLDSARRALLLRAGGGAPDRWLRRRYYVALALLLLLGVAASEPFGHREGAAVPIVDDAAVSTLSTRRPLATPAATMDWDMVDARDAVQALAAHFGFDFAVAVDFLQRAEHGGGGGALAAVHRLDMTCACDIWRGGGARAGTHHCGLEWWYGKSSGGKVWQRGVSGCVKGCVLENVNGEDNCFSVPVKATPGASEHAALPPPPPHVPLSVVHKSVTPRKKNVVPPAPKAMVVATATAVPTTNKDKGKQPPEVSCWEGGGAPEPPPTALSALLEAGGSIACVGGSSTAGGGHIPERDQYPALLQDKFGPALSVFNMGHGGMDTTYAALNFNSMVPANTTVVIWEFAINDGATPADVEAFRFFLEQVDSHPRRPAVVFIFFWDVIPPKKSQWNPHGGAHPVYTNLEPLVRDYVVLDAGKWVTDTMKAHPECKRSDFVADAHHPSKGVHHYVAEQLGKLVPTAFLRKRPRPQPHFAKFGLQIRTASWLFDSPTLDTWPASSGNRPLLKRVGKADPVRKDRQLRAIVPLCAGTSAGLCFPSLQPRVNEFILAVNVGPSQSSPGVRAFWNSSSPLEFPARPSFSWIPPYRGSKAHGYYWRWFAGQPALPSGELCVCSTASALTWKRSIRWVVALMSSSRVEADRAANATTATCPGYSCTVEGQTCTAARCCRAGEWQEGLCSLATCSGPGKSCAIEGQMCAKSRSTKGLCCRTGKWQEGAEKCMNLTWRELSSVWNASMGISYLHDYNFEVKDKSRVPALAHGSVGWKYVVQHSKSGGTKAGLLCTFDAAVKNQARFNITGCSAMVEISFLRSYENFGAASAVVVASGMPWASTVLQGHRESMSSQAGFMKLRLPQRQSSRVCHNCACCKLGKMKLVFKGTNDNPGTDAKTRAAACSHACQTNQMYFTPSRFSVSVNEINAGRCWCFDDKDRCTTAPTPAPSWERYNLLDTLSLELVIKLLPPSQHHAKRMRSKILQVRCR